MMAPGFLFMSEPPTGIIPKAAAVFAVSAYEQPLPERRQDANRFRLQSSV